MRNKTLSRHINDVTFMKASLSCFTVSMYLTHRSVVKEPVIEQRPLLCTRESNSSDVAFPAPLSSSQHALLLQQDPFFLSSPLATWCGLFNQECRIWVRKIHPAIEARSCGCYPKIVFDLEGDVCYGCSSANLVCGFWSRGVLESMSGFCYWMEDPLSSECCMPQEAVDAPSLEVLRAG